MSVLAIGALGVVFGDIGTSPLYTLRECLSPAHGIAPTPDSILGILSLIFWSLVVVIALKYLTLVLRADNHGEGGIFALLALIPARLRDGRHRGMGWATVLVIAGAALLYGDGMITPAISVLSAVEGLQAAAPGHKTAVIPATCLILVALFALQRRGTGAVGKLFGPVMLIWFLTLGALGLRQIVKKPEVLTALDPFHAVHFFLIHRGHGFLVLGSVVLAITGGEALYADLGHFGRTPIRVAWFALAMPALVLNYFGQGALMLGDPRAITGPFFAMVPAGSWTYALVALSTAATVIASQALISGVFSLTHQAVQLGFFPVVTIKHTSRSAEGQIYIPEVNWGLAVACVALVLTFRESTHLAAAYGLAVTGTMAITSLIYFEVTRTTWRWPLWKAVPPLVLFLSFDLPFFTATMFKFREGGFVPVLIGAGFFGVMFTWRRGWNLYREQVADSLAPLDRFLSEGAGKGVTRVPGIGVFVTRAPQGVPPVLSDLVTRIRALPQRVVLLSVTTTRTPHGTDARLETAEAGIYRVTVSCGFMDRPDVPRALGAAVKRFNLPFDLNDVTYYLGRHTFVATSAGHMGKYSEWLFAFLTRNSRSPTDHFGIPWQQVVEIGSRIDL
jgi:KUP system potassium uptake protein